MMPLKSLRVALSNIMVVVEQLEALLPASMVAIADKPLPKGGYTIEATKGILSAIRNPIHTLTKADKLDHYSHFYDDFCIANYLLGLVAKNIAFFPDEPYDADMANLAVRSFKTVFRYAPYIIDDTYAYYFSHYNMGLIMRHYGHLDKAEEKFRYLLSTINPTLLGLPALVAGKGRNSLEVIILAKAHAAMFLLNEDRQNAHVSSSAAGSKVQLPRISPTSSASSFEINQILTAGMGGLMVQPSSPGSTPSSSDQVSYTSANSTTKLHHHNALPAQRDFTQFPTVDNVGRERS